MKEVGGSLRLPLVRGTASSSQADLAERLSFTYIKPVQNNLSKSRKFFLEGPLDTRKVSGSTERRLTRKTSRNLANDHLTDRLELFELRRSACSTVEELLTQQQVWTECVQDMISIVKLDFPVFAKVLNKMNSHAEEVIEKVNQMYATQLGHWKQAAVVCQKQLRQLEKQYCQLEGSSAELLRVRHMEELEFQEEIRLLFEKEDCEIELLKESSRGLKTIDNSETIHLLKELYKNLSKDRDIPSRNREKESFVDPDEFTNVMMQKYSLLQRSTASRVLKLLERREKWVDSGTQTTEDVVLAAELTELQEAYQLQSLQHEIALDKCEKMQMAADEKQRFIEKLETQQHQQTLRINNANRDIEKVNSELAGLRLELMNLNKTLDQLNNEKAKLTRQLEARQELIEKLKAKVKKFKERESAQSSSLPEEAVTPINEEISSEPETVLEQTEELPNSRQSNQQSRTTVKPVKRRAERRVPEQPRPTRLFNPPNSETLLVPAKPTHKPTVADYGLAKTSRHFDTVTEDCPTLTRLKKEQGEEKILKTVVSPMPQPKILINSQQESSVIYTVKRRNIPRQKKTSLETEITQMNPVEHLIESQPSLPILNEPANTVSYPSSMYVPGLSLDSVANSAHLDPRIHKVPVMTQAETNNVVSHKSVGVNYNSESPEDSKPPQAIYLMPFNPNTVFGLRGDSYFERGVFHTQPRIPELTDSFIFKPPFEQRKD